MDHSKRNFLKEGLAGAITLGALSLPEPIKAFTRKKEKAKQIAQHLVMISLDGICVEGFQKANTPNLDKLLAQGALSIKTRVVMPSVTLPNWTSHLTGSGPEQHGVVDNSWEISKFKLPAIETDDEGYYPSVFKVLKDQMPEIKTAFYYNWAPLINPYNKKYFDEISFLEEDGYRANYDKAFNFLVTNRANPTLTFLYSVHTDHAGHKYKWMSPEYIRSIEEADVEIGSLIDRLKQNDLYQNTHFMFLSDHGGLEYGHGGVSTNEMIVPWGITGAKIKEGFTIEEANNTVNTASVILFLFGAKQPKPWTGEVLYSIFKENL